MPRNSLKRRISINLTNNTDDAIRVVGGTSDCKCITTEELPVTLPAGTSVEIPVRALVPHKPGLFRKAYRLYTDDGREAIAGFTGYVVADK